MRRGFTTGSCASAAVKAAIQLLQFDQVVTDVHVTLPGGEHYLVIPIASVRLDSSSCATAEVIKDAGDDPDNTNNATIFATVSKNGTDVHKFIAGGGVGTVTQPGIRVAVGEPAINPGPRQMMLQTISELYGDETPPGFDIKIGCINGVEIAKRTFNPRLGIINGISILGTTGIVEPFSLAAYMASIEVYIRVALGESPDAIAFLPGNIGIRFSRDILGLTQTQTVHISNYIGFSIAHAEKILLEQNRRLSKLWLLGHPGKLGKLLNDEWDTHSSKSAMAMGALARVADSFGFSNQVVQSILESNTVEAVVEMLSTHSDAKEFWKHAERLIADMVSKRISTAKTIEVRLFGMAGSPLGEALGELNLPLGAVR
jgi:cobalt-precorrin-5B (C1)-methyltransferase